MLSAEITGELSVIVEQDISDYLDTQSDFDLELFTLRTLQERGIQAAHGGFYIDPIKSLARQFDVRAHAVFNQKCEISFAIECKNLSEDRPLVVSRVPRPGPDSFHEVLYSWGLPDSHATKTLRNDGRMGLYSPNRQVGKKTDQIFKDKDKSIKKMGDSESYQKWSQAFSSADELIKKAAFPTRQYQHPQFFTFILPILVVSDRALWVADYSEDGARVGVPLQTDETTLWADREYAYGFSGQIYRISHLHIYTRTGFQHFVQEELPSTEFQERVFGSALRQTAT